MLFVIATLLIGCITNEPPKERPGNKWENQIGFLNGHDGKLYVKKDMQQKVLEALEAEAIEKGKYKIQISDLNKTTEFEIVQTDFPHIYSSEFVGFLTDTLQPWTYIKVYTNSECDKIHPGFISNCIFTFGRHKKFGNSMQWTVNKWKSCRPGKSICIEVLSKVGEIIYYPGWQCMDTSFVRKNILRFRCDFKAL